MWRSQRNINMETAIISVIMKRTKLSNYRIRQELLKAQTAGPKCQTNYSPTKTKLRDGSQLVPRITFMILTWQRATAYLAERGSRSLFLVIFTRRNPMWCHHSTSLKILVSAYVHIEKVAPTGCRKICSTQINTSTLSPGFLSPSVWNKRWIFSAFSRGKCVMLHCL